MSAQSHLGLTDRRSERRALDRLIKAVRDGESRTLVVRGEPGVGKTVLLNYLVRQAHGCQVGWATGIQSEMELAYAGLHQLCAPLLSHAEHLPIPQRDALRTAFGMADGPPPDRFLVGLGTLSLLSEVAGERPLICIVDDEQWLDRASAQALGFAARRLAADSVGLVFAAREPSQDLAGLPELGVAGLLEQDARALLDSALTGPLDQRVRDQIIAETNGNPLALLELPRGLSPAELAGGFGLPGAQSAAPLTDRIEESFVRQLEVLPAESRQLVQLAAADPSGDRALVWQAAARLGLPLQAADPAAEAGLVEFGARVQFRHPLARSAAYRSASRTGRRQLHAALAEVTDPITDPDRRVWHRAQAAAGPDEEIAAELERSAGRAQARGGLAAAAAFLERAVLLTVDPARHSERALAAAQASMHAGAFGRALELLATAEAGPLDNFASARADLLRGQIALASGQGSDAPLQLLKAASRFEQLDLDQARETYLHALTAAGITAHLDGGFLQEEIAQAALALPAPDENSRPVDQVLYGFALLITEGHAAAAPVLQRAASALADIGVADVLRWGWATAGASAAVWDFESFHAISSRQLTMVRAVGALAQLTYYLAALAGASAWIGDLAATTALIAESDSAATATGGRIAPYTLLRLRALQGNEAETSALIASAVEQSQSHPHWAAAVLYNGLARYEEAESAARQASKAPDPWVSTWVLPELVEAAARGEDVALARDALDRLTATTQPSGSDIALGIEARCRALLSHDADADALYREAIDRLGRTQVRPELARAHLLYGEWLRREGRRTDAQAQLRTAHDMLAGIGMAAFAERARRELIAAGEKARRRSAETVVRLTAQQAFIARLAAEGHTNLEIGTQLFLSPRTVEWHLRNIFTKLGVGSRRELRAELSRSRLAEEQPA